jgi:type I restriction enzyme, S subunit
MKPWPMVPLEEVLLPVSRPETLMPTTDYRLLGAHWYAEGLYIKDIKPGSEIQANQLYRVQTGDFVYNRLFAWKGSFAFAGEDVDGCYVSNEFRCFRLREDRLDGRYLHYYFSREAAWNEALGLSSGGTPTSRNRLKEERFLAMSLPLPPIEEQRRIVNRLESLFAKIGTAQATRTAADMEIDALRRSSLASEFDELSATWECRVFGAFCQVVRGGSPRPAGSPVYYDGPIPFLKVADLTKDDEMYLDSFAATIKEAGLSNTRLVPAGTLMLTNSGATLGVPKICRFETTFNDGIQAFLNIPEDVSIEYLYMFFASKTKWFREWAARGQGQPNLNTEMVKQLAVPLPPMPVQQQVVRRLTVRRSGLKNLEAQIANASSELAALRLSLLNEAFSGQL